MSKILTDSYSAILRMAGLAITDDGCVSVIDDNKKQKPLTIKGKRLVLPTDAHLNNSDWTGRIVFHPGNENFHRGESVVMERYRNALMLHLNQVIVADMHRLLQMGTDLDIQATMTPDQQEYLIWVKDATDETIPRFLKILGNIPGTDLMKTFIKIYMRRGAKLEDRDFGRAGIVSFPFYEMLLEEKAKKGQKKIYNVVVSAADLTTMIHLLEYMFPGIAVVDKYSRGTNVQTNAIFDSLMRTALAIAEPLNSLCDLFGDKLGDEVRIDVSWAQAVMDNNAFYKEVLKVPMQSGNEGSVPLATNDTSPAQPLTHPSVNNQPIQNAPSSQPGQLTGFAALTGRAPGVAQPAPAPVPQPAPQQQYVQPVAAAPVQQVAYHQPQQQLYNQFGQPVNMGAPQQAVNVRNPDGSTNFAALIASDPALANAAGVAQGNAWGNQNRAAPNSRATLSNPVAQTNNGWGQPQQYSGGGWGQPQQQSGWGQPQLNNGWGQGRI